MAKVFNYSFIILGTMMLLAMLGVTSGYGSLFTMMFGDGTNFETSTIYVAIIAIFSVGALTSLIIGLYTRQNTDSYIRAAVASLLFGVTMAEMSTIINVANSYAGWISNGIKLIMYPLMIGYAIAIVQWWGGNDI